MRVSQVTAVVLLLAVASPAAGGEFVFGPATHLGPPISSDAAEEGPFLSADGLSLYIGRAPLDPGGYVWYQTSFHVFERASVDVSFTGPARELNPDHREFSTGPSITADGLSFFYSSSPGPFDDQVIYEVTRNNPDVDFDFANSVSLGPNVNHGGYNGYAEISWDGLTLVWDSPRPGGYGDADLWTATRATRTDPFDAAENLGPQVNSPYLDGTPCLSSDGLALFFNSDRPGGFGRSDLWVSYRDPGDPWREAVNLGPDINTSSGDWDPMLSADGSTLYFASDRPGGIPNDPVFPDFVPEIDFYQVSVNPLPPGIVGNPGLDNPGLGGELPPGLRDGLPSRVPHSIPEPSSAALAAIALAVLGCMVWRKHR